MISINQTDETAPTVPVDSKVVSFGQRMNNLGMRSLGRLGWSLSTLLGPRSKDRLGILTYHRIAPHTPGLPPPAYNVTPARFREQLSGLQRRGFQFIALREALEHHHASRSVPPRSVVVTFDDCFESVYTAAWPILSELQVPATMFLSTAYLDSNEPFPFDIWSKTYAEQLPPEHYRPLRVAQCQEMAESGLVEFGTHTHTHADFRQHLDHLAEEMQISQDILRRHFGVEQPMFAFPFGGVKGGFAGAELMEVARKSGVSCALTTETKLVDVSSDPFGWGRLNVFDWDTSATLTGKLSGWYDWAHRLKHRLDIRKSKQEAAT